MKIFYIGYFFKLVRSDRFCSPAANNVCTYIKDVLAKNKKDQIFIINIAQSKKHFRFSKSYRVNISNVTLIDVPCFGSGRLLSKISLCLQRIWITRFLRKNSNSDDAVVIYHSLNTLSLESKISNRYNAVLQVEEIYSDIFVSKRKTAHREIEVINKFNKHVFVSKTMSEDSRINPSKFIILYGSYSNQCSDDTNRTANSIVYAGTLDKDMGVNFACELMKVMPDYNLTIFGHGKAERLKELRDQYYKVSNITILPAISEQELGIELKKFRFALSPRDPDVNFNSTSFPSKILTYLKNGLIVISSRFHSVLESPFREYLILPEYNYVDFKKAIENCTLSNAASTKILNLMDIDFTSNFLKLIKNK